MRTISPAAQAKLNQQYGTEPIVIVEIQWVEGGQRCLYADRRIADATGQITLGQIVEMGTIDAAVKADGSSDSTQVHLVLDDTDGAIKAISDTHDLHKRPVWVYQWFDGLTVTGPGGSSGPGGTLLPDKFLLFKGEINSPFVWNEGDRTVSFDVTTKIEDVEAGFSMEEGDFPIVPPDALGKAWPLVFGSVCDVKAVQVRAPRYGILQSGEGIHDYTLESRICQARFIQCANVPLGQSEVVTSEAELVPDPTTGLPVIKTEVVQNWGPDQSCVEERWFTICDLMYQLGQQKAYEHPSMVILGASTIFPQNERITINIEGGKFTGHFSGEVFYIEEREHPDYAINPPATCGPVADRSFAVTGVLEAGDWVQTASGSAWYDARVYEGSGGGTNANPQEIANYCNKEIQTHVGRASVGGPADAREVFDNMNKASFFWARAGSKVYLEAEAEVLYIVNLLPCTITRVAAMKQTAFGPKLVTVPADYYTIYETDYDGYTVTEIGMTKPLSQQSEIVTNSDGTKRVEPSKWSDDLYVTLTSSVGPNPADIIEWLVGKYTPSTVDAASFAYVKTRLANYPSNFALLERKNVMELIADIATQSRCVVYVRNDVVYLKYASEEPTPAATITESDVLANTLKLSLSNTEEVATKHVVTWSKDYTGDLKLILKYNVAKYGTHEKTHAYYTQNVYDNVLKSATFWAIRDANVWKTVEFSTPLKHLGLEVFDCVTLNLSDLAPTPVKAVITSMKYDAANEQVDFICWTPLRAAELVPYIHAWPADIPAGTIFPTTEEREAGLGYSFTVKPPEGHLLYVAQMPDGNLPATLTSGDPYPSDLDDTLQTCFCPSADDAVVEESDPVFDALKKAERAARSSQQSKIDGPAAAGGINDKKEKPQRACGSVQSGSGCVYEVKVEYITPDSVQVGCKGFCGGGQGRPCTGTSAVMCHTFGARFSATMFANQIKARITELQKDCWHYITGQAEPLTFLGVTAIPGEGEFAQCEDAPGSSTNPNQGESAQPGLVS